MDVDDEGEASSINVEAAAGEGRAEGTGIAAV